MRLVYILFFLAIYSSSLSQNREVVSVFLPEMGINVSLSKKMKIVGKVESMNGLYSYTSAENTEVDFDFIRTDIQAFLNYSLNPLFGLAIGYQYRFLDIGNNSQRTIQQFSFIQRLTSFRLSHRLRSDQTFFKERKTEFRFRYRLSAEFPLQGRTIDAREFYLVLSGEPIYSIQGSDSDLEGRLTGSIGYLFNRNNKLQFGPDYRIDRLLVAGLRQQLWMKIGWFLSI